jgi:EmrB/QacA subfamily drug resistance transporter
VLSIASPPCDAGLIRGAPETPGCASHAKRWVLTATVLGSSIASVEASVINVALPAIQEGLHASVAEMQWIASIYTLFLAALTLVAGSAGDRYGRRPVFALGLGVLGVASAVAGSVGTGSQLIVARAVQGVGAAMVVPNSLALLSAAFPKAERGRAIGTWSSATALTTAGGPVLGGLLVDALSWRAAFVLIVPLVVVTAAIAIARVPEVRIGRRQEQIDWSGALLAISGLAALVFGVISLAHGFSALVGVGGGLALVMAFVERERRTASPMMPPRLFHSPTFVGANILTLLLYFALSAAFFVLPFDLVRVQGYSATATGAAYLPFALLVGGLSRRAGGFADRFGARTPLVVGSLVTTAGFLLLALPGVGGSYWTTFFVPMAVIGLGMAITVAPLTATVMGAVDERDVGVASGVNNTVARVAGLLAVAIAGVAAVAIFGRTLSDRLMVLDVSPAIRSAVATHGRNLGDIVVPASATAAERGALEQVAGRALVTAFRWVAALAALLGVGAALAALGVDAAPARAPTTEVPDTTCTHLDQIAGAAAPRTQGCEECLRLGERWVHLRVCLSCGHVGCCDSSRHRHATAHFWGTAHPIVRSLEPGETWRWCYVDETTV